MGARNVQQKDLISYLHQKGFELSQSAISQILNDKRKISVDMLNAAAEFFAVPISYFFSEQLEIPPDKPVTVKVSDSGLSNPSNPSVTKQQLDLLEFFAELGIKKRGDAEHLLGLFLDDQGKINQAIVSALGTLLDQKGTRR